MHAITFLKRANKGHYWQLITDLVNQFTRGTDQYPPSITETFNLLVNYKKPTIAQEQSNRQGNEGKGNAGSTTVQEELTFAQQANGEPPIEEIQCYNCQQMGHYAISCMLPWVYHTGVRLLQCATEDEDDEESDEDDDDDDDDINCTFHLNNDAITITQKHMINQNWVLLDSDSTVNIFSNKKFLWNIHHCETEQGLCVHSNGGFQDTTHMIEDLTGFGLVWYNKGSLANILSLAAVRNICRITMDTLEEAAIVVHKHNGDKMKFMESSNGLYYYDAKAKSESNNYSFINSANESNSLYTQRQLKNADLAKQFYELVGCPSHATRLPRWFKKTSYKIVPSLSMMQIML